MLFCTLVNFQHFEGQNLKGIWSLFAWKCCQFWSEYSVARPLCTFENAIIDDQTFFRSTSPSRQNSTFLPENPQILSIAEDSRLCNSLERCKLERNNLSKLQFIAKCESVYKRGVIVQEVSFQYFCTNIYKVVVLSRWAELLQYLTDFFSPAQCAIIQINEFKNRLEIIEFRPIKKGPKSSKNAKFKRLNWTENGTEPSVLLQESF